MNQTTEEFRISEQSELQPKRTEHRVGYFFLSFLPLVLCLLGQFAAALGFMAIALISMTVKAGYFDFAFINQAIPFVMYSVVLYHVIGVLGAGLWFRLCTRKEQKTSISEVHGTMKWAGWFGLTLLGIGLCFFANATTFMEVYLTPQMIEDYIQMTEGLNLDTDVWMIIAVILLAPIGEELLFRGLTLRFAKKSFRSFWAANILQALMFAIAHLNWVQGIYAFVIGLFLGALVHKTKSLVPSMIVHFVVNFSSTVWVPSVFGAIYGEAYPEFVQACVWLLGSAIFTLFIYHFFFGRQSETKVS